VTTSGEYCGPPLSVTVIAAPQNYPTGYSQGIESLAGVEDM